MERRKRVGPSSPMEAGGGAGGRGSPLLFGGGLQEAEEEQEETLVLYCGSEGEEEAAGGQKKARVAASLGLDQDFSERDRSVWGRERQSFLGYFCYM